MAGRAASGRDGPLIVAPLAIEASLIRLAARSLRVRSCGMGHRRARAAAARLAQEAGSALVVMGFGGALEAEEQPGTVIVASEVRDPAGRVFACAASGALLVALQRRGLRVRCGPLVSVERPARGAARAQLLARTGAIAVDMESAWLAPAAGECPFGVVRVLVDTPARELDRPWLTFAGGLRAVRSLGCGARAIAAVAEWGG